MTLTPWACCALSTVSRVGVVGGGREQDTGESSASWLTASRPRLRDSVEEGHPVVALAELLRLLGGGVACRRT